MGDRCPEIPRPRCADMFAQDFAPESRASELASPRPKTSSQQLQFVLLSKSDRTMNRMGNTSCFARPIRSSNLCGCYPECIQVRVRSRTRRLRCDIGCSSLLSHNRELLLYSLKLRDRSAKLLPFSRIV